MVADDDVDAEGPCVFHLVDGGDAAVDGDEERSAEFFSAVDPHRRDPVSFLHAVGDMEHRFKAELAEILVQHRGAVRAVDIVVAEDKDALFGLQGREHAIDGEGHAVHKKRVVHVAPLGPEKLLCGVIGLDTPVHQDARNRFGYIDFLGELLDASRSGRRGNRPTVFTLHSDFLF